MADLEKTCKNLENYIMSMDVGNYRTNYTKPDNKTQEFLDKVECYVVINGAFKLPRYMNEENEEYNPYNPIHSNMFSKAYDLVNEKYPGEFNIGEWNKKNIMTLIRNKPGKCAISGKLHERENSYIIILENTKSYYASIGCNRRCTFTSRNVKLKKLGEVGKKQSDI